MNMVCLCFPFSRLNFQQDLHQGYMIWDPLTLALLTHSSCPTELQPSSTCLAPPWTMAGTGGTLFPQQLLVQCLAQQLTLIAGNAMTDSSSFGNLLPRRHYFHLSLPVKVHPVPKARVKC